MLLAWDRRLWRLARKMWHPHRLGMDHEDIHAELRLMVLRASRKYAHDNEGGQPPDPFIFAVAWRRMCTLIRAATRPDRVRAESLTVKRGEDGEDMPAVDVPDITMPSADTSMSEAELAETCQGLVYALQRNMPPAMFGVLYLRFVEELSATEIADLVGLDGTAPASKRLDVAKCNAQAFLRQLGVANIAQVSMVPATAFTADELDDAQ
jgi:DNA-directed RNA polymerase specialized sigma24 family protein